MFAIPFLEGAGAGAGLGGMRCGGTCVFTSRGSIEVFMGCPSELEL
jgi:hypothetical protein